MPTLEKGGVRLHYELSGASNGPVLMLANSLGSNLHMWDKVLPAFEKNYRVLRYDMRGHGKSSMPSGTYNIEQLAGDSLSLLDHLAFDRVHFCGLSIGGLIAMWVGIHAPQRLSRVILANTAARIGTRESWQERITMVQSSGMGSLAQTTPERWFTALYREQHPQEMNAVRQMVSATNAEGYCGCCAVLRDTDLRGEVAEIQSLCLVISGTHDLATPPSNGRELDSTLRNSDYLELDASHISAWEKAKEFSDAVLGFLGDRGAQ